MKKLMMTLAAALSATALMAVTSQNVVGYNTLTFKEGYNLIGVQFEAIGAGGGTIDVQDLFTGVTLQGLDDDGNVHDFMYVWNNATGFYETTLYWADNEANELVKVWIDADYNPAEYAFKPGDAFWVYTAVGGSAAGAVTLGQVSKVDALIAINPGYNLIANPFPTPLEINGGTLTVDGLVGLDDDGNVHDFMYIWNNATGFYETTLYWADNEANELIKVWIDADYNPVNDVVIAPNTAFWIYHNGAGAGLTFSSPL
jgi:hypothetical protein